jgi:hypothetical protein
MFLSHRGSQSKEKDKMDIEESCGFQAVMPNVPEASTEFNFLPASRRLSWIFIPYNRCPDLSVLT